ncbi:MAG: GTP cyclohydrolase I FolE [Cytophagales bacterium]|nr:GTP cyclohydrolase I FolE [Armatimonadota bacterium]
MMQDHYRAILEEIGEDPNREGLLRTPYRAQEAMKFLTRGYTQDLGEILNNAVFAEEYDDMVIMRDIEFYSLCEHHLLPFYGRAHIAYIPNGKIVGISKMARIVDMFARRLQVQERLTMEIGRAMQEALQPKGVAVVTEAKHMCMLMRGVEKQNSLVTSSHVIGAFRDDRATRSEFMRLLDMRASNCI